ncbi:DUF2325 domain-containing protein [Anderseniella sp. Alg231-50]|uniref:DUF2325 domain-containing protein n=1 Tax=Anderseniella sp. Alg231-50 TaxID=1922226 RepID=UPI00307C2B2A
MSAGDEGEAIEKGSLPNAVAQAKGRRIRLSEMGHWCCSVIGTCLTHDDLLIIARKWNVHIENDARVFDVHGFFARKAGEPGDISRAIEKMLDGRYGGLVRRVANTSEDDRLVDFWNTAVNDGFVAGAYWAVISHRHVSDDLRNRIFGEVHMMSHLLGGTARKIVGAAAELQAKVDQMERRQERWSNQVRHALDVRDGKIAKLQDELGKSRTKQRTPSAAAPGADKLSKLNAKQERALIAARTRARQLANELEQVKDRLSEVRKSKPTRAPQSPVASFDPGLGLCGKAVLYLGGRQASVPQIAKAAEAARVSLLHHDGGLEQSTHLIDDLISRCDAVICPVDCINHQACLKAKKLCKKMHKPFMPVSSRGTTTFQRALAELASRLDTGATSAMQHR